MRRWTLMAALALSACARGPSAPAEMVMGQDACAHCRMVIVSRATAAQIASPGEDPVFFDEIGCLRDYLSRTVPPLDAVMYVADHRTGAWVDARSAVFTYTSTSTPMASGLLAHADAASREADPAAGGGTPATPGAVLGSLASRSTP